MEPELIQADPDLAGGEPPAPPSPVETEAKALGWAPKDQWRGDPERWVDAETFVERGHTVLPILRANEKKLLTKLSAQEQKNLALEATVSELREAMTNLTTFQASEVKRQVDAQVAQLKEQRIAAREAGDIRLEASLEDQLDAAKARQATLKAPAPPTAPKPPAQAPAPDWAQEFAAENSDWLGTDKDKPKTAMFAAIAEDLREKTGMNGRPLLDAAKKEMELRLGTRSPAPSKLEGAAGGDGGSGSPNAGADGGKGFSSLPPDAKAQCNADEKKFVGPNKAFKTAVEWRKHYANVYFNG